MRNHRLLSASPATPDEADLPVSGELRVRIDGETNPVESGSAQRTPSTRLATLPQGYVVGNYVIEKVIDVGGGGIVYAVCHRVLGRRAALKALRDDAASSPSMIARFVREAAAVNKIQHPNIVDIYEFGEITPGRPYYVMELLEGVDLRKLLREQGRFSPAEALPVFEAVCRAVQAAHDAGIIHRDIKSSNVIIVDGRAGRTIKLVDFGICKPMGESTDQGLTEPGSFVGTVHNMAPEQVRGGPLDARTDVYALGVLLFQMLTGHYPFDASAVAEIALQHLQLPAPRPSASAPVPPVVDAVVLRCLEKSPERRYPSVSALLDAFRSAVVAPVGADEVANWGVGVYFEILTDGAGDMDDAMLVDIGNVLDTIEEGLSTSSFVFPIRASNALLGVRLIGSEVAAGQAKRETEATLMEWRTILAERPERHPAVRVAVSLSVGQAVSRGGVAGVEIVGGALLDFAAWKDDRRVWTG
jgi:serine/threonine-protein kinase